MSDSNYIPLEDLDIYKMAMEIGELVWNFADSWEYFAINTIGKQFVTASDSIAANISEGYGRFHFKDKRTFYYYARGSLSETKTWATKSKNRALLKEEEFLHLYAKLSTLHKSLNKHIKSLPIS
jgi:four helix bundle protein